MTVEVVEGENNRNVMDGSGGGENNRSVMAVEVVVVMYPARIMQ